MSALFNQTNSSPGTAFAGGGSNTPFNPTVNLLTASNVVGWAPNAQNGVYLGTGSGTSYNTTGEHAFGYQNVDPVGTSGQRWYIKPNEKTIGFNTGIASADALQYNINTNQYALPSVSTINGVAPGGGGSSLQLLISPDTPAAYSNLAGTEFGLASNFLSTVSLNASTIYKITLKSSLSWSNAPASNDWMQIYLDYTGQAPDDTRIFPGASPFLTDAYGGNFLQNYYLDTLFRTTSAASNFDVRIAPNLISASNYSYNVQWLSLETVGPYN